MPEKDQKEVSIRTALVSV